MEAYERFALQLSLSDDQGETNNLEQILAF